MPRGDDDGCPAGAASSRIENQIIERAPHLIRIEARLLVVGLAFERHGLGPGELDVRRKTGLEKRPERDGARFELFAFGHAQQTAQQRVEPLDLPEDHGVTPGSDAPGSPAMAFSALSRIAAIGFRISCATPAATWPIAASRSPVAICRAICRRAGGPRQAAVRPRSTPGRCGRARARRSRAALAARQRRGTSAVSICATWRDHVIVRRVSNAAAASTAASRTPRPAISSQ